MKGWHMSVCGKPIDSVENSIIMGSKCLESLEIEHILNMFLLVHASSLFQCQ